MEKSFPEAIADKITLLHAHGQRMDLVVLFERTPEGVLAGIDKYYNDERSAIEIATHGDYAYEGLLLVIFDFAFSAAEIDFIVKDENLKLRRAAAYIRRYQELSILRPVLATEWITPPR